MFKNGVKYSIGEIVAISAILVNTILASESRSEEVLVDRLVAEVNGSAILHSSVMSKIRKGNLEELSAYPATSEDSSFKIALHDLINQKLVFEKVAEAGIEVGDDKVSSFIQAMLSRRGMSMEQLRSSLNAEGISYEEYFNDSRKSLLIRGFQKRFIEPFVNVSEKEVESYYFKMLGSSAAGVRVRLRKIVVSLSGESELIENAKKDLLKQVQEKLEFETPFADAAKLYSEDDSRDVGGLMPELELADLAPQLRGPVEKLLEGEYTSPIVVGRTAYIFYLEEKLLSNSDDFTKRRPQIEMQLKEIELRRATLKWIEDQRRRGDIRLISH